MRIWEEHRLIFKTDVQLVRVVRVLVTEIVVRVLPTETAVLRVHRRVTEDAVRRVRRVQMKVAVLLHVHRLAKRPAVRVLVTEIVVRVLPTETAVLRVRRRVTEDAV